MCGMFVDIPLRVLGCTARIATVTVQSIHFAAPSTHPMEGIAEGSRWWRFGSGFGGLQTGGAPLPEVPLKALAVAPGRHLVPKMAAGRQASLLVGRLSRRGRLHVGHFSAWVETFTLQL